MMRMSGVIGVTALAMSLTSAGTQASALPVDWSSAQVVTYGNTGLQLYFGFQPQEEQEGIDATEVELLELLVRQSIGVDSSLFEDIPEEELLQTRPVFTLLLGATGPEGPPGWGPAPDPVPDEFRQLDFALDIGSETLTARLNFRTEPEDGTAPGLGTDLNELFFNPQPEPPALSGLRDSLGFGFTFTSFSTALVELTLLDANGTVIEPTSVETVAPIPLPPSVVLLAGGVAVLGRMSRRKEN